MIITKGYSEDGLPLLPDVLKRNVGAHVKREGCSLTPKETEAFAKAYELFAEYVANNNLEIKVATHIIYTDVNEVTFENTGDICGVSVTFSVYYLHHIRSDERYGSLTFVLLVALEEIIHALLLVRDEYQVKEISAEVARQFLPEFRLHLWFPEMFDDSDQRIYE